MYVVLEKGKVISTEIDFGNAAEMQLALEMDNTRSIRIMKEDDYLEQMSEMESMCDKRLAAGREGYGDWS